ncbi:MAG: SPOR domain-containing protein [Betaproteobacteria bacterium]|nr:SPOR domain-containing protein [Betaproteobacteria bacterium]
MAEPADINVDELRRRARRRLVGAVVLALAVAVIVPMLLETRPKPLGDDVSVKIPPVDDGKFINRLSGSLSGAAQAPAPGGSSPAPAAAPAMAPGADAAVAASTASGAMPAPAPVADGKPPKYDTRIPDAGASGSPASGGVIHPAPAPVASVAAHAPAAPAAEGEKVAAHPAAGPAREPAPVRTRAEHADSGTHEGYAVQLAAFSDDKGANALAHRLKSAGYSAYTEPLKTSKGTLWRVRVGPYPSRQAAIAARDRLKREGHSGIVAPPR